MAETSIDMSHAITPPAVRDAPRPIGQVGDFVCLLKPRVMSLVVFTGFAGLAVAPGELHPLLAGVAILCIAVAAGAAGCINMWYERDIDAVMERTKNRPIPAGRVDPDEALSFGVILSLFAIMLMGVAVNWVAAALLAGASIFYIFVYTVWLKRRTPQNIVIGGAAGAFPPMIGWAAVTGTVSLESVTLFTLIFLWTPPHFWALALCREGDYAKAGIPMMPVVAGARKTKLQMLIYTLVLVPVSLLPTYLGTAGVVYGLGAAALGLWFVVLALKVMASDAKGPARRMFGYSIFYLFLLFALLALDRAPGLLNGSWGI